MAEFVKVASISELEVGSCKTVEVNGKAIALFNVDGQVFALDNACLHQGGPLGEGMLEGEVVTCPWHFWEFNVRTPARRSEVPPSRFLLTRCKWKATTSR